MSHHPHKFQNLAKTYLGALIFSLLSTPAFSIDAGQLLSALQLPADPKILESFETAYVRPDLTPTQTEAEAEAGSAMIRKLQIQHVGENRLLIRVDFDQKPRVEGGANFLFYLDSDNNPETGREGVAPTKGVDVIVVLSGLRETLDLRNLSLSPENTISRAVFVEKSLFITIETPLPESVNPIQLRGWLLSQRNQPLASTDSCKGSAFSLPRQNRAVPRLIQEKTAAQW